MLLGFTQKTIANRHVDKSLLSFGVSGLEIIYYVFSTYARHSTTLDIFMAYPLAVNLKFRRLLRANLSKNGKILWVAIEIDRKRNREKIKEFVFVDFAQLKV